MAILYPLFFWGYCTVAFFCVILLDSEVMIPVKMDGVMIKKIAKVNTGGNNYGFFS